MEDYSIEKLLKREKIRCGAAFLVIFILILTVGIISLCMGATDIAAKDVFRIIWEKLFHSETIAYENISAIIWNIRLPRIICSALVGMGLGVSGAVFQGILRNPLADPYTIGISSGASFAASAAIVFNMYYGIYIPVSPSAMAGAFITLVIVILISRKGNSFESVNIIMAGIIISSVFSSGVSFMKMLAGENVAAVVFWIMGSLSAKSWGDVLFLFPLIFLCTAVSSAFSKRLDIMAAGDDNALSLGVDVGKTRLLYMITGSVTAAACVSVCGVIGFVGLIVPHILRLLVTAKNKALIPLSAAFGALLLMSADTLARNILDGEIPVGVLTTLIGGPFFIFVFMHDKQKR